MGLLFVGCGLAAWFRTRTEAAAFFALYGLFYGMHWGGVIPAYNQWLANAFALLHLVLSDSLNGTGMQGIAFEDTDLVKNITGVD